MNQVSPQNSDGFALWAQNIQSQMTQLDSHVSGLYTKFDNAVARIHDKIEDQGKEFHKKMNETSENNFTKNDMEDFVTRICNPTRSKTEALDLEVGKLKQFRAKFWGVIVTIQAIFAVLMFFKDPIVKTLVPPPASSKQVNR